MKYMIHPLFAVASQRGGLGNKKICDELAIIIISNLEVLNHINIFDKIFCVFRSFILHIIIDLKYENMSASVKLNNRIIVILELFLAGFIF